MRNALKGKNQIMKRQPRIRTGIRKQESNDESLPFPLRVLITMLTSLAVCLVWTRNGTLETSRIIFVSCFGFVFCFVILPFFGKLVDMIVSITKDKHAINNASLSANIRTEEHAEAHTTATSKVSRRGYDYNQESSNEDKSQVVVNRQR
jgi:hypothetical protein